MENGSKKVISRTMMSQLYMPSTNQLKVHSLLYQVLPNQNQCLSSNWTFFLHNTLKSDYLKKLEMLLFLVSGLKRLLEVAISMTKLLNKSKTNSPGLTIQSSTWNLNAMAMLESRLLCKDQKRYGKNKLAWIWLDAWLVFMFMLLVKTWAKTPS